MYLITLDTPESYCRVWWGGDGWRYHSKFAKHFRDRDAAEMHARSHIQHARWIVYLDKEHRYGTA